MERVLQRLGLTSKKSSIPYQYRSSSGHAAYGTNKSGSRRSNFQSSAHRGGKTFGGDDDDPGWMELTATEGPNGSKEDIVSGPKDVVITTDIVTRFEDVEHQAGLSSGDSSVSEELVREMSPIRKV